jgi:hypothetical protein
MASAAKPRRIGRRRQVAGVLILAAAAGVFVIWGASAYRTYRVSLPWGDVAAHRGLLVLVGLPRPEEKASLPPPRVFSVYGPPAAPPPIAAAPSGAPGAFASPTPASPGMPYAPPTFLGGPTRGVWDDRLGAGLDYSQPPAANPARVGFWLQARVSQLPWSSLGWEDPCVHVWSERSAVTAAALSSLGARSLPLWPVPLVLVVSGVLLVHPARRAARRAKAGRCTGCGYNLAGLRQGFGCPECGPSTPGPAGRV